MAVTTYEFNHFKDVCLDDLDWNTTTLKIALIEDTYSTDLTDTVITELTTANECSGTGYTAGGKELTSTSISGGQVTTDPLTWTALTCDVRFVVLYASGTVHGLSSPVLLIYDLGSTLNLAAIDWTFSWTSDVVYELT